jgi:hypothetical protein
MWANASVAAERAKRICLGNAEPHSVPCVPRVARLSSAAPTMLVQVEKQVSLAAPSIATI